MIPKKLMILAGCLCLCSLACAQEIPIGQDTGSTTSEYTKDKKARGLLKRLLEPKAIPPAIDEEQLTELAKGAKTVYIKKVIIQHDGSLESRISQAELDKLASAYEDRGLSIEDMEKAAMSISRVLSDNQIKVYIPRQTFNNGLMYINVVRNN